MDGNQKKIRNLLLYIGIPVVVLFIIIFLFNNRTPQTAAYKYSDIIGYFQDQEVSSYTLNLGTGEMVIHLEDGKTVGYVLPSVDLFYMDVRDSIQQYNEEHPDSKMVQDIHPPPGNQLADQPAAHTDYVRSAHHLLGGYDAKAGKQHGRRQADEFWQGQDQADERREAQDHLRRRGRRR